MWKNNIIKIYEKDAKFYNEEKSENTKSEKKEKEMTLKDFDREVAQKKGGVIDEEQEEMKVIDNQGTHFGFFEPPLSGFEILNDSILFKICQI